MITDATSLTDDVAFLAKSLTGIIIFVALAAVACYLWETAFDMVFGE